MACLEKITAPIPRLLAAVIGALFIWAGILKALDPAQFAAGIGNFRLLPHAALVLPALYLPWLEIICGAALVMKKIYRGALLILTALILIYLAALFSAMARGLDVSCGCFGRSHSPPLAISLLLDFMLLAALGFLCALEFKRLKT